MKISVSNSVFNDLERIIEHYTAEGALHVGLKFVREIVDHIQILADHLDAGRIVPEFQLAHIREIIQAPFRVVYLREKSTIKIIRVWRSERLLVLPTQNPSGF